MIARTFIALITVCLLASCTSNVKEASKPKGCDTVMSKMYLNDLKERYKQYRMEIDSQVERPMGFIAMYLNCAQDSSKAEQYTIINGCNAYGTINGKGESLFYAELVCFDNAACMDSIVATIKRHNCIDPYNLKLDRVYKVGVNTAVLANFYPTFDVPDFEVFLMTEFERTLSIEVINTYQ